MNFSEPEELDESDEPTDLRDVRLRHAADDFNRCIAESLECLKESQIALQRLQLSEERLTAALEAASAARRQRLNER